MRIFQCRLTPAYLMMIGLYSSWFIKIGNGPLWKQRIELEQERCQLSWWKNILYINNYYGNEALCMFQSWYLAGESFCCNSLSFFSSISFFLRNSQKLKVTFCCRKSLELSGRFILSCRSM